MALPKKNKSNISNSSFITCKKLFEELDWEITDDKCSLFKKFAKRYDILENKEQKDVFLDLARKYTIVELEDYLPLLKNILISKYFKENTDKQNTLLFPLIPEKDIQDIKSSSFLIYLFFHYSFLHNDILYNKKFSVVYEYQKLSIEASHKNNKNNKNNKNLLLIDDYIGSGQTAIESLENIFQVVDSKNHNFAKITILCLYINELGLKNLYEYINSNDLEVDIIYYEETKYNIDGYEDILESINLKEPYNGHEGCGDLITLIRTPNNTIPLFRKFIPKNPAPFHRNSK